jgi:hypothetical protein
MPTALATLIALLPIAGTVGPLVWLARMGK